MLLKIPPHQRECGIFIWVRIFSLYTLLLTVTALGVVFILRKRRSSILKNQRPPRTPFSEVEFNVETPTDTTKSRRVSFSRRTGVAEFITNEATTTWKNFYEEHNKSLELSGNESSGNQPKQTIQHIGKSIFDQQFEEVEVFDFGGTIQTNPPPFQSSFNNPNNVEQFATLECTFDDRKPVIKTSLELSALTEHSKPFGNELSIPYLENMTNPISMNFTVTQPGTSDKCDDLDEIQRDLELVKTNVICAAPTDARRDFSSFIEIDFNMTHVALNVDSEMSITDTIESPKVQEIKSNINIKDKSIDSDWVNDKENIAINPYVMPEESLHFAINKESDEILVFDGKRLTTQSVKLPELGEKEANYSQSLFSEAPQRKTITLNTNDDLPNFIDTNTLPPMKITDENILKTEIIDDINMSITAAIDNDIAILQRNVLDNNGEAFKGESHTIYDTNNISFTQAVPCNIIPQMEIDASKSETSNKNRNTIIFNNDSCNVSMTQALPVNINFDNKENVLLVKTDCKLDDNNLVATEKQTIMFDDNSGNISVTQALPININCEKENEYSSQTDLQKSNNKQTLNAIKSETITFDSDSCNVSITQALPTNINIMENKNELSLHKSRSDTALTTGKRKTIVFDTDSCDLSITQALPANIVFIENNKESSIHKDPTQSNVEHVAITEKRKTIIFDSDTCDISITQALPTNIAFSKKKNETVAQVDTQKNHPEGILDTEKRKTIIFDTDSCDISITQALPVNINFFEEKYDLQIEAGAEKQRTIICDSNSCDLSITQAISTKVNLNDVQNDVLNNISNITTTEKRKTIIFDDNSCDVSITQALPASIDFDILKKDSVINNTIAETKEETLQRNNMLIAETASANVLTIVKPNVELDNSENEKITSCNKFEDRIVVFDTKACDKTQRVVDICFNENKSINKSGFKIDPLLIEDAEVLLEENKENFENRMETSFAQPIVLHETFMSEKSKAINSDSSRIINKDTSESRNLHNRLIKDEVERDNVNFMEQGGNVSNFEGINKTLTERDFNSIVKHTLNITPDINNLTISKPIPIGIMDIHEDITDKTKMNNITIAELSLNDKSVLTNVDNTIKDVLVYQVETNEGSEETNQNEDKSEMKENILWEPVCDENGPAISNESPVKFVTDDEEQNTNQYGIENTNRKDDFSNETVLNKSKATDNALKPKKSILNELLDMSCVSIDDRQQVNNIDSNLTSNDKIEETPNVGLHSSKAISEESYLLINSDSEPDGENLTSNHKEVSHRTKLNESNKTYLNTTNEICNIEDNMLIDKNTTKELIDVNKKQTAEINKSMNRPKHESYKNMNHTIDKNLNVPNTYKSVRNADNTKDLLAMLNEFTDEDDNESTTEEKCIESIVNIKGNIEVESKNVQDPRRLSFATKRQSIVISREDLLHGISMAKAILQQSRFEVDESEVMDDTLDFYDDIEQKTPNKSTRVSSEVVKMLQFEDESISDTSIKSQLKISPLKKTVIEGSSYLKENKVNVIPTYLKDVTDNIKEIMHDLVKPTPDVPFEKLPDKYSTHSTQIQANLITSSQIDVELHSNYESVCDIKDEGPIDEQIVTKEENNIRKEVKFGKKCAIPESNQILIFDHKDPLKNILIPSVDCNDVHTYNPLNKEVNECSDDRHDLKESLQYNIDYETKQITALERDDISITKSDESGPLSIDRSEGFSVNFKDTEVNTVIAMRENKELLGQTSSLTLVDAISGELSNPHSDETLYSKHSKCQMVDDLLEKDSTEDDTVDLKSRKRDFSTTKKDYLSKIDITPKPVNKMQKISNSPSSKSIKKDINENCTDGNKDKETAHTDNIVTIQHVDIEYNTNEKSSVTSLSAMSEGRCSGTSEMQDPIVTISQVLSSVGSQISNMDWQSPKETVPKCPKEIDSSSNVVAKLNMLPFMGSPECLWDWSGGADTWSFRLLRGRLRVRTRLAHRHHSALRTYVRADTPLVEVDVDILHLEEKDTLADVCVRLAADAMRYERSRLGGVAGVTESGACAGAVPLLLRRCVAVARLTLRWARAMRDARARLAYDISKDGLITLKVANIPLRCVWEVRMRVALVVGDARSGAWPRADDVCAVAVLAARAPAPASLQQLAAGLPCDWGHAPRTLWKVFKYLKNRTREEELLGF